MKTIWMLALMLCAGTLVFAGSKHQQILTLRWQPISAEQHIDGYSVSEDALLAAEKKLRGSLSKLGLQVQLGYIQTGNASISGPTRMGKLWIGSQTLEQLYSTLNEDTPPTQRISADVIVKAGLAAASKLLSADARGSESISATH
jgi:hypothetical protein